MADSAQTLGQLQQLRQQFSQMVPADEGAIYDALSKRVGNFRPQYDELRGQEADIYSMPARKLAEFQSRQQQGGYAPSSLQQLSSTMQDIGQGYRNRDVMADMISQQRGRLEDITGDLSRRAELARSSFLDRYNMLAPVYQSQIGLEEAARGRGFQAEQAGLQRDWQAEQAKLAWDRQVEEAARARAASGGGGGGGFGGFGMGGFGDMGMMADGMMGGGGLTGGDVGSIDVKVATPAATNAGRDIALALNRTAGTGAGDMAMRAAMGALTKDPGVRQYFQQFVDSGTLDRVIKDPAARQRVLSILSGNFGNQALRRPTQTGAQMLQSALANNPLLNR